MKPHLVIAGGSGFLGDVLADYFSNRGWDIVILTRAPQPQEKPVRDVLWDGENLGDWTKELEGAQAVINLAGVTVNCRYHARNRQLILDSRINSTRILGEAIAQCAQPPAVWLNSSTATIYKHNYGAPWTEDGEIGSAPEAKDRFSVEVATAWERAFQAAATPRTRKVILRSAMVLGTGNNSVFPVLHRLVSFGLGGKAASGNQFVSWIHERDFCRAIEWLIDHEDASGIFNLAAPHPVTNAEMMRTLRGLCHMPIGLPATAWMLELGAFLIRTETELVIKSRRVTSSRLPQAGFTFDFVELRAAFADLLAKLK